jgi:beta-galactosidase
MLERTVRPQESGARRGVRWARLSVPRADGTAVTTLEVESGFDGVAVDPATGDVTDYDTADGIALTVRPWSTETLAATTHDHLLRGDGRTHVVLDAAQHGVGTGACGPGVMQQYRLTAREVRASIRFRISER